MRDELQKSVKVENIFRGTVYSKTCMGTEKVRLTKGLVRVQVDKSLSNARKV